MKSSSKTKKAHDLFEIFKNAPVPKKKMEMDLFKDREIVDVEVDGVDMRDYPKFCDAYISRAVWGDTGEELTDSEIDELNQDYDFVSEKVYNHAQGMCD